MPSCLRAASAVAFGEGWVEKKATYHAYSRISRAKPAFLKPTTRAHLAVLATNFFFAFNFSMIKLISPRLVPPFAMNVLRVGLSLVLFWFIWMLGKTGAGIQRKHWGRFAFCALTGVALNQMLFIRGLTLTSTIHASLLILVTPILVTLFAIWVLREGMTANKAFGLLLGVGGSALLILQKEAAAAPGENYLLGDLFILCNAIAYSAYYIAVRPLMKEYSPLHVTRWVFTLGLFMILPLSWNDTMNIRWEGFRTNDVLALASVVVTGTFLPYYFTAYGLQRLGAGTTGTYIYTQPVFTVLIAVLFLGETFTWQKSVAALLIFSGVFLVSWKKSNAQSIEKPPFVEE